MLTPIDSPANPLYIAQASCYLKILPVPLDTFLVLDFRRPLVSMDDHLRHARRAERFGVAKEEVC